MRREYLIDTFSEYTFINCICTPNNGYDYSCTYMDTLYVPTVNTRMVIDIQDYRPSAGCNYMGVRNPNFAILTYYSASKIGAMVNGNSNIQSIPWDKNRHVYDLQSGSFKIDGIVKATPTLTSLNTNLSIWIFNTHSTQTMAYDTYDRAALYSAQIYENNILVRDYKPAKRNADNALGLLDIVNNNFLLPSGTAYLTETI